MRKQLAVLSFALAVTGCSKDSTAPGAGVLSSILLVARSGTVTVGDTMRMRADPKDQNGSPVTATVTWTSSATLVATVSNTGLVTAMAPGTTMIAARSGSVSATPFTVTVIASGAGYPTFSEVFMPGNVFSPVFTDIAVNGVVAFIFPHDPHNAIWAPGSVGAPPDIDILADTTVTRKFTTPGFYTYNCLVHPGMTGYITVH